MSNVVWPLDGVYGKDFRTTSSFGWRTHPIKKTRKHHNGEDLVGQKYVRSMADGLVLKARASNTKKSNGEPGGYGYFVVVRHKIDGVFYTSLYAHLKKGSFQVKQGQKVKAGQVLGIMGTTGASTGIHLHWEIWKGKTNGWSADGKGFADPIEFVKAYSKKGAVVASIGLPSTDPEETGSKYSAPANKPKYEEPLLKGSRGEDVAYLQKYLGITVDGIFGPQTHEAVLRFMAKHDDIKVKDGVVGPITWNKIPSKMETVKKARSHKVVRGETLSKIARKYDTTVAELTKLNKIKNASLIKVGQVIKLPAEEVTVIAPPIDPPAPAPKICECCKRPLDD